MRRARSGALSGEHALLALLLLAAGVPLGILIVKALAQDDTLTGATGILPADQLQYLAWIRDAGAHGLAASRFDLTPAKHVLLDPLFEGSALLWRIGLPIQLAYLLWLPLAALVLFGGFRAYVRRTLPDSSYDRALALGLALFFTTPVLPLLAWSGALGIHAKSNFLAVAIDTNPSGQLWGYFPIAIDLGLFAYTMLWVERTVTEPDGRRYALRAATAALLIGWLHPWQGVTLILILLVLTLFGRPLKNYAWLLAPLAATGLPLVYFSVLPHIDHAWKIARDQNALAGGPGWGMILGTVGPLALLALGRPRLAGLGVQGRILVIWPLVALFVYWLAPPYPIHSLETLSLPLAVLALRGWRFLPARRWLLGVAALVLTLPGIAYTGQRLQESIRDIRTAYLLPHDDARALSAIDADPAPGGVLAPAPQALAVPGLTGRNTWIGHPSWTTAFELRIPQAQQLFAGQLSPRVAQRRVRRIGAPILLAPCGSSPQLAAQIRPLVIRQRRLGCATVFRVRVGADAGSLG
jgi:hypothetical protein